MTLTELTDLIKNYTDRIIILKNGLIIEEGITENIFENPLTC